MKWTYLTFKFRLYRCWSSVSSLRPLWRWCWTRIHLSLPVSGWSLYPVRYMRWAVSGVKSPFLFLFTIRCSSVFVCLPVRSRGLSWTWCISEAVSLALCSISVDVLYACTSEPDVTRWSVNWTFPALWGITCCCVTMGRSSNFIYFFKSMVPLWKNIRVTCFLF